jgi:hypothetical protein
MYIFNPSQPSHIQWLLSFLRFRPPTSPLVALGPAAQMVAPGRSPPPASTPSPRSPPRPLPRRWRARPDAPASPPPDAAPYQVRAAGAPPRRAPELSGPTLRVVVVTSVKGGVGKTTISANLVASLARLRNLDLPVDVGLRNLDLLLGLKNRVHLTATDVLAGGLPPRPGPRPTPRAPRPAAPLQAPFQAAARLWIQDPHLGRRRASPSTQPSPSTAPQVRLLSDGVDASGGRSGAAHLGGGSQNCRRKSGRMKM